MTAEGLPDSKKELIRDYCKAAGFYSYDAASLDEDPVSHWIGREVKRFLDEAHVHLPFLLQIAAAPADCIPDIAECTNADGEQEMEYDPEYAPTAETTFWRSSAKRRSRGRRARPTRTSTGGHVGSQRST